VGDILCIFCLEKQLIKYSINTKYLEIIKLKEKRVISDIDQLTIERLTKILKKKRIIRNEKVTKIIKKSSEQTTTSMLHFLEVKFSSDPQTEPASLEIAVKITKFFGKGEVKFYNIVAKTMKKMSQLVRFNVKKLISLIGTTICSPSIYL